MHEPNLIYTSHEGHEYRRYVPDVWKAAELFCARFCPPPTREDELRFERALAISKGEK